MATSHLTQNAKHWHSIALALQCQHNQKREVSEPGPLAFWQAPHATCESIIRGNPKIENQKDLVIKSISSEEHQNKIGVTSDYQYQK
jgi:hypothetical protein